MPHDATFPRPNESFEALAAQLIALREENALLRQQKANIGKQKANLDKKCTSLLHRVEHLSQELAKLQHLLFGRKSERYVPHVDPDQLALFEVSKQEIPAPAVPVEEKKPARRPRRRRLRREDIPEGILRERQVIEPDEDTSRLKPMGVETSWYLEIIPATLKVVDLIRRKYVDPDHPERGVIIGELPSRIIDKCKAGPGLLAHVTRAKFVDHIPHYRLSKQFKREGIDLSTSTLGDWTSQVAWHLNPLYEALKQELAEDSSYLQVDETTLRVQDRNKKQSTHRGYMWTYLAKTLGLVVMDYRKTRARAGPEAMLASFKGAMQSDGYSGYDGFDRHTEITTYACMAHARRYFHDCLESDPKEAGYVLGQIRALYAIERQLREQQATAAVRCHIRQKKARPILEALEQAIAGLPRSQWGKAVRYSLKRWEKLTRYVDNGEVEIDNNGVENALRPLALGRKNYLFAGSHDAAQRAAVFYSLFGTCLLHEFDPQAWLTDVLKKIPEYSAKRVHELLPHRWKLAQQKPLRKAA